MDAGAADVTETVGDSLIEALARFAFRGDKFMKRRILALAHAEIVAALMSCALDAVEIYCLVTSWAWCLWKKRTSMMMSAAPTVMAESATLKAGQW